MSKSEYELLKSVIDDLRNSDDEIDQLNKLLDVVKMMMLSYEKRKYNKYIFN